MNVAFLLIGGNMGDRKRYLLQATQKIQEQCGEIAAVSSIYETEAWGLKKQGTFLNQVLKLHTIQNAEALLQCLLSIETELGRYREEKYGPRIIDIDILLYNDAVIDLAHLQIPHPQLPNRRFALQPLCEVAPSAIHPVTKKSMQQMLTECTDELQVIKTNE